MPISSYTSKKILITLNLRCLYASKRIFDTNSDDDTEEELEMGHRNLYKSYQTGTEPHLRQDSTIPVK